MDQYVKDTIAQVPEFLARNRKLISPHALVASYRYARFMEIVEVAKEFLLGILGELPHPFTYLVCPIPWKARTGWPLAAITCSNLVN